MSNPLQNKTLAGVGAGALVLAGIAGGILYNPPPIQPFQPQPMSYQQYAQMIEVINAQLQASGGTTLQNTTLDSMLGDLADWADAQPAPDSTVIDGQTLDAQDFQALKDNDLAPVSSVASQALQTDQANDIAVPSLAAPALDNSSNTQSP